MEKQEKEDGRKLWEQVPKEVTNAVIQATIGENTINDIFQKVDKLKGSEPVDVVIGGPPCQAYSVAGHARMGKDVEKDPHNELYKYYVKFLERYKPKMFVFENILGIRTAKNGKPFEDLQTVVDEVGYKMEVHVQIASQHGVLQNRQRVIIVGWQKDTDFYYPALLSSNNNKSAA